jgi:predicted transcriptional regulator
MARKRSGQLAARELQIMKVVWAKGRATVQEVQEALASDAPLAYTTILTMMRILEQKGYLGHEEDGRTYVYYPRVGEAEASRSLVRDLIERVFDGSPALLMQNILEAEDLSPDEMQRLKRMIAAKERKEGHGR